MSISRCIYRENALRKGIYREATILKRHGWYVMANYISGFDSPPEIEGYTPEIYAIKENHTFILHIATGAGYDDDKYRALYSYASGFSGIHFRAYIIDAVGRRIIRQEMPGETGLSLNPAFPSDENN